MWFDNSARPLGVLAAAGRRSMRNRNATLIPALLLAACASESSAPPSPSFEGGGGANVEEEIFGRLVDFADEASMSVAVEPLAGTQPPYQARSVVVNFNSDPLTRHLNKGAHYGWFAFDHEGECVRPDGSPASNVPEVHRNPDSGEPDPASLETHCAHNGQFRMALLADDTVRDAGGAPMTRVVDFQRYAILDSFQIAGQYPVVDLGTYNPSSDFTSDLLVWFDRVADGQLPAPVIEAQVARARTANTWLNATTLTVGGPTTVYGPVNHYFRFAAANSVPSWLGEQYVMVRYFWDMNAPADRTGFTNILTERAVIRAKQYGAQGTYAAQAHLVEPDDWGPDEQWSYGRTLPFTVVVYGSLNATPQIVTPGPWYTGVPIEFREPSADDGSGALTHTWRWGDGSPTATGETAIHAFASPGTYPVTVDKQDGFGALAVGNVSIAVVDPPPPPPPLSVSITFGPSSVKPKFPDCQWRATAQGGQAPYQYTWKIGSTVVGTGRWLTMNAPTSSFTLVVIATDAAQADTASRAVTVSAGAPPCP